MRYLSEWMELTIEIAIVLVGVATLKLVYDLYKVIKEK